MSINLGWRTAGSRTARWQTAGSRTAELRTVASRIVASRTGDRRLALGIAGLCLAFGCTKRNPDLCCETDAECTTIGFSSHAPCDLGVCVHNECTTAAGTCDGDEDCAGTTPACVAGTCSVCATSATCPATAPVCDMTSHDCRTCTSDPECDSGACDLAAGTCVDQAEILYAAPGGTNADPCIRTAPCSFSQAGMLVDPGHPYIVLLPGVHTEGPYFDGKNVTVCGNGATLDSNVTSITLANMASVRIRDLSYVPVAKTARIHPDGAGSAFTCNNSSLTLDNVRLDVNPLFDGIQGGPTITIRHSTFQHGYVRILPGAEASLTIDRSTFLNNAGILVAAPGSGEITNSVFESTTAEMVFYLHLNAPSDSGGFSVRNNTFVGATIGCNGSSAYPKVFNSNILYNTTIQQTSDGCEYDYNLSQPTLSIPNGQDNISGDPLFRDLTNNNFHLMAGSPAIDAADPTYLMNGHDLDGTPRPQGMHPDIGAFEYVPATGQIDRPPRRAADHP
ncbi:MAG TPA: choice-of-anchor Q domain-containing protein [Kofleriaceae bacterium]|jgi:hypothetical protein|nr:choice-of-anchor Q domain-containing protein [Kofleriaceae bacterium]